MIKNKTGPAVRKAAEKQSQQRVPITSYYAGGSTTAPDKRQDRHYAAGSRFRLIPTCIAILVIVGSIFFSLTLSSHPSVEIVGGAQSMYRDQDEYAQAVAELMNHSVTNKTKLTVKTDELEQEILRKFPELRAAALRLPVLGRKPTLIIDMSRPYLLLASQTQSFVLDQNGIAVSEVKYVAQEFRSGVPLIQDKSGIEIKLGQQVLPSTTVQFVKQTYDQLAATQLKASGFVLPVSINELDIYIEGLSYFIKTDTSGDARLQIGSFLATKNHLEKQGIAPKEYIDVRVEEKVFYK